MKKHLYTPAFVLGFYCLQAFNLSTAQNIDVFSYQGSFEPMDNTVHSQIQFNGYTNYWHDTYRDWYRYGNLFKMSIPNVEKNLVQSRYDMAEELGLPGLTMQEGFMDALIKAPFELLDQPSIEDVNAALKKGNVLVLTDPGSETGKKLLDKAPKQDPWRAKLKSYQFGAVDLKDIQAFYLSNQQKKLFVVASDHKASRTVLHDHIKNTLEVLDKYDLHRGWFGASTLLKSVTCVEGHPLEVIGRGMNEGNTWFIFDGYMDFLAKDELAAWMEKVGLPVVANVGFNPIYGCRDYEGLQVQDMNKEAWIKYAHDKGGYAFGPVYDPDATSFDFDGYIATEGHKEQIDGENIPFIQQTGSLAEDLIPCMMLFIPSGTPISDESLWEAIMDRREVAVMEQGKMMGPALYRNALQMLLLDRIYLEEYYGDRINLETQVDGYTLHVAINNTYARAVSGNLEIKLPAELKMEGKLSVPVNLPARSVKTLQFKISPQAEAMDNTNPIAVHFQWDTNKKSTLAMLDLPHAISVHRLLYGHAPTVEFPVTIHNFKSSKAFPVNVEVFDTENPNKAVFKDKQNCDAGISQFKDMKFNLVLPAGNYNVKVSALGMELVSQLGVGKKAGAPYAYELDLNSDGVMEYRMENDSVQVTLLATGARVIEYIVKSRDDNVLFKLWPEKAVDDKRSFRKRGYYPYGGFEDFLGQGSMETHKVYDATLVKKEGDYVRVQMIADYYGNKLQKTFTLYGNSPLLEVRFALTFKNPEANVLGPQPILELGEKHWTEDVFTAPDITGMKEYRMRPEEYYGQVINLKEGWTAGYDTVEDITFVGAFPVSQPLFQHMWMNHPRNSEAHHYYVEFQPWTPIYQKSTMYFTHYLWGAGGPWENGVQWLRSNNLISIR